VQNSLEGAVEERPTQHLEALDMPIPQSSFGKWNRESKIHSDHGVSGGWEHAPRKCIARNRIAPSDHERRSRGQGRQNEQTVFILKFHGFIHYQCKFTWSTVTMETRAELGMEAEPMAASVAVMATTITLPAERCRPLACAHHVDTHSALQHSIPGLLFSL